MIIACLVDPSVRVYVASTIATGFVFVNNMQMALKKVSGLFTLAKDTINELSTLQDAIVATLNEVRSDAEELAGQAEALATEAKQELAQAATVVKTEVAAAAAEVRTALNPKLEAKMKRKLEDEMKRRIASIQDQIMSKMQMQSSSSWKVSIPSFRVDS
jgi:F0F1-type ATP synthase membrane subunit b/b'